MTLEREKEEIKLKFFYFNCAIIMICLILLVVLLCIDRYYKKLSAIYTMLIPFSSCGILILCSKYLEYRQLKKLDKNIRFFD